MERAAAWLFITVGLGLFCIADVFNSWGEQHWGIMYSSPAEYIWKSLELERNSLLARAFGVLLAVVGCLIRIAIALEERQRSK